MPVGSRRECLRSSGAAAVPDIGISLLFIFFWVRSLNSRDLEYLQVKGKVFARIRRKKSFMWSGSAGEAETTHARLLETSLTSLKNRGKYGTTGGGFRGDSRCFVVVGVTQLCCCCGEPTFKRAGRFPGRRRRSLASPSLLRCAVRRASETDRPNASVQHQASPPSQVIKIRTGASKSRSTPADAAAFVFL
jgi:hypothetical protein